MEHDYQNDDLKRLFEDASFDGGFSRPIVRAYRKRVELIIDARDERDIAQIRGNHYEKLSGRDEEYSVRLNDQWRLAFTFENRSGKKTVILLRIEDYH